MVYDKSELEELSTKYFGQDHERLSPQEKLVKLLDNFPLDSIQYKAAVEGARKFDSTRANEVLYDLMTAFEELPSALEKLEAALSECEKRTNRP